MGRSVICESYFANYLKKLGKDNKTAVGLLLGQSSLTGNDYIVHMAKTPETDQSTESSLKLINNVGEIDNSTVAEHALNTIRMIGASFNILGLFVVSETSIFNDNAASQKLKTILLDIKSTLESNGLLYANTDELDSGDKLILNYTLQSSNYTCKTISSDPSKAVSLKAANFKFSEEPIQWQQFESSYEVEQVFPLIKINNQFDTEKSVMNTIDEINGKLKKSLVFFNGVPGEKDCTLEKFNKDHKLQGDEKVKVTIYSYAPNPYKEEEEEGVKIKQYDGLIHFSGIINSRVFGIPKNTLGDIEQFVKQDIIRSLTTRLQIYYDALLANDDGGTMCEHESNINNTTPPRRVFYPVQNSKLLFNDYLFSNEFEDTTVKQVKDVLDFTIKQSDIITKAETFFENSNNSSTNNDSTLSAKTDDSLSLSAKDKSRLMLIIGIVVAILVLIVSIILHLVLN